MSKKSGRNAFRWAGRSALLVVVMGTGTAAYAQDFLANKKFNPTKIESNSSSDLTFDLFNSRAEDLKAAFTDTLPLTTKPAGQLWFDVTSVPTVMGEPGCTIGTRTYSDFLDPPTNSKARTVSVVDAAVPQHPTSLDPNCQITFKVYSGVMNQDETVVNQVPKDGASATNTNGVKFGSDPFDASLTIGAFANPLPLGKSFSPANVGAGGVTTMTITIRNDAKPARTLTNVAFSDPLLDGLIADGAPTFSPDCGAPTSTTTPADNPGVLDMSGASIASGKTCTITLKVKTPNLNQMINNTIPKGGVTADGGISNNAAVSANVYVRNEVKMTKVFGNFNTDGTQNGWRTNILPVPNNLYGTTFNQGDAGVVVNQPVPVRVYFSNPNMTPLTGGSLTDYLPYGLVAVGGAVTGNCTTLPTTSISAGADIISFSGFGVPAANATTGALGTCYVEFYVKGIQAQDNNINALNSSDVSFTGVTIPEATSSTIDVTAPGNGSGPGGNIVVEKQFISAAGTTKTGTNNPLIVNKGETFWMRIAVRNNRYDADYTGGTVSDTLPTGLRVDTSQPIRILQNPPVGSNANVKYGQGCGDMTDTAHATDGSVSVNGQLITYSGWTLHNGAGANNVTAKNQGCFISVPLVSDDDFLYINKIDANTVTTDEGVSNISGVAAEVAVLSDLYTGKFFNPALIGGVGGAKTRLTLQFTNSNKAVAITDLAVTDPLPSSAVFGTLTVANPANVDNQCGGTVTAAPGTNSVSIAGGTVAADSTCLVSVDVVHTAGTNSSTSIENVIPAGAVTNAQGQTNRVPAKATITTSAVGGINVTKSFAQSSANGGRSVRLTLDFSVTGNTSAEQDLISLTDNMPEGMVVATPANITTTCVKKDGTEPDIVATSGAQQFSIAGFRFDKRTDGGAPHNACKLELDVVMTTTGNKTNVIDKQSIKTAMGTTNADATSASLSVLPSTTVQKQFAPKNIEVGQKSTLTLTIFNVRTNNLDGFKLTDMLPALPAPSTGAMVIADPANATTTCGQGVVTATPGSGFVKLENGTVTGNAQCTVTVDVTVNRPGAYLNNKNNFTDMTPTLDPNDATDTLTATASSLRGTVFVDPNLNASSTGFLPAEDTGLGGVTVELFKGGKVIATATTAAADLAAGDVFENVLADGTTMSCTVPAGGIAKGQYLFCNLSSGEYAVRETQPAGYTSTGNKAGDVGGSVKQLGGANESIESINLPAEKDAVGYDFGEYKNIGTVVSGRVYVETGGNTTDNGHPTDPGLVTKVSIACTGPAADSAPYSNSMNTNADGTYSFTGMLPGAKCTITETQPPGYTNVYTQTGITGEPGTPGPLDESEKGTTTDSVIKDIVVPVSGSPGNNFAEVTLSDMTSTTVCTPKSGPVGTAVQCTVTCTNNGPSAATNAACTVTNRPNLPSGAQIVCENSPMASLEKGNSLSCKVTFNIPDGLKEIPVLGGASADNDINGGKVPTSGNNPSDDVVTSTGKDGDIPTVEEPEGGEGGEPPAGTVGIPTMSEWGLILLSLMVLGLAAMRQRKTLNRPQ